MNYVEDLQDFTDVTDNGLMRDTVVTCIDWFEVRTKKRVNIDFLQSHYGYSPINDKGCVTHYHYFETKWFSLSWDIKASFINDSYTHIRLKNEFLYCEECLNSTCDAFMNWILDRFFYGDGETYISRIDVCFDMLSDSQTYFYLRSLFKEKAFANVDRFGSISGNFHGKLFTNYYAGNRGSAKFFRLYNKTVENTDYQTNVSKKQYITDIHFNTFGKTDCDIWRFEIEYKPVRLSLDAYNQYLLVSQLESKYIYNGSTQIMSGLPYDNQDVFTKKDAVRLSRLLDKLELTTGACIRDEKVRNIYKRLERVVK